MNKATTEICPREALGYYKGGNFIACYCKILKPGHVVAVMVEKKKELCPLKDGARHQREVADNHRFLEPRDTTDTFM